MSKKTLIRLFFGAEILIFFGTYFFGPDGIKVISGLNEEHKKLNREITALKHETFEIENQIAVWQSDDFYKEKIAREQLQMARKDEQIFYTTP